MRPVKIPSLSRLRRRVITAMRLALRICVACGVKHSAKLCDDCKAKAVRSSGKYRRHNRVAVRARVTAYRARDPQKWTDLQRAYYWDRKIAERCTRCGTNDATDTNECDPCAELTRAKARRYAERTHV